MRMMAKIVSEILCIRCGEPLAEDDLGRYYAHVCASCCEKNGLCADCGHPVIITLEQANGGFMCSGSHEVGGLVVDSYLIPSNIYHPQQ